MQVLCEVSSGIAWGGVSLRYTVPILHRSFAKYAPKPPMIKTAGFSAMAEKVRTEQRTEDGGSAGRQIPAILNNDGPLMCICNLNLGWAGTLAAQCGRSYTARRRKLVGEPDAGNWSSPHVSTLSLLALVRIGAYAIAGERRQREGSDGSLNAAMRCSGCRYMRVRVHIWGTRSWSH